MSEAMTTSDDSFIATFEQKFGLEALKKPASLKQCLAVVEGHDQAVADVFERFHKRVKALEARIAELESRPALKYMGVYRSDKIYLAGNFVTYGGSLWHCNAATSDVPGEGQNWTLAAKRGNDGNNGGRR